MGIAVTVTTDPVTSVTTAYPGGPLEVLLNNTKYSGRGEDSSSDTPAVNLSAFADSPGGAGFGKVYYSEIPTEGQTEIWELVNLTADAHPIHLHLVQFQLIDRQNFNVNNYNAAYNAAFPGGVFIGGYGPPLAYLGGTPAPRAIGGNPDIYALNPKNKKPIYMQGTAVPALPQEAGWKDTVVVYPGQVTRLAVRWAPTDGPNLYFKFDPDNDLGHGYVWHCHIIDHEDNEMMRPTRILEFAGSAARDMSIIW